MDNNNDLAITGEWFIDPEPSPVTDLSREEEERRSLDWAQKLIQRQRTRRPPRHASMLSVRFRD